ncbi:flagellar protein FlaG [Paenibacillus sp. FSL W7-1279]|uniref:flagellar protein FlaG n=1 Tax=Paenibacillus sp. FSL W7-1279 TaxID=2921697 RepID=UPI0030DD301A
MRIDSNSNPAQKSLLPWFNKIANEVAQDVHIKGVKPNQEKNTIPELVNQVNEKLKELGTHIQVKVHEKTNTIMVMVLQDETNEIIREIPSEKMLEILYNISQRVGVFLDEKM